MCTSYNFLLYVSNVNWEFLLDTISTIFQAATRRLQNLNRQSNWTNFTTKSIATKNSPNDPSFSHQSYYLVLWYWFPLGYICVLFTSIYHPKQHVFVHIWTLWLCGSSGFLLNICVRTFSIVRVCVRWCILCDHLSKFNSTFLIYKSKSDRN